MKIAFILYSFPDLSTTFILNQITGLIDRGHDIDIYSLVPGNANKYHEDVEKYKLLDRTYYWPLLPKHSIFRYLKASALLLYKFIKNPKSFLHFLKTLKYVKHIDPLLILWSPVPFMSQQKYDIIHAHFGPSGVIGAFLRDIGIFRGKLITTFHGYDVNRYSFEKDYYEWLFRHGDFYTANTSFTANRAITLGCPFDKIDILPVGVDVSKYFFKPRQIHSDRPVNIITVARLVEKKGIKYAIEALAKVNQKYPNFDYKIVGDGILRQSLENLAAKMDIFDKVRFLGWQTQEKLIEIFKDAHIFLLPSVTASDGDSEGQGLVLQEAQAMGIPVLSTLHNGIPDGVVNEASGFLVPEKDVNALAEKLTYLIEHPEVWPEMGRFGRKFIENRYNIEMLNDKLVDIYKKLLGCEKF